MTPKSENLLGTVHITQKIHKPHTGQKIKINLAHKSLLSVGSGNIVVDGVERRVLGLGDHVLVLEALLLLHDEGCDAAWVLTLMARRREIREGEREKSVVMRSDGRLPDEQGGDEAGFMSNVCLAVAFNLGLYGEGVAGVDDV